MGPQEKRTVSRAVFILITLLVLSACDFKISSAESHIPSEFEWFDVLNTVQHLPGEVENLNGYLDEYVDIKQERLDIIVTIRGMADYLEDTHNKTLIVNRVGTGFSIASGVCVFGGLLAMPFNPLLAGQLMKCSKAAGVFGGVASIGANGADYVITKTTLASLEQDLVRHQDHLQKLSKYDSDYMLAAANFRSTLKKFKMLNDQEWGTLINVIQNIVNFALEHDYEEKIVELVNHVSNPAIKELIQEMPLPLDPKSQRALSDVCTQILKQLYETKRAIKTSIMYLEKLGLVWLEKLTSLAGRPTTETAIALKISDALMSLPLAKKSVEILYANIAKNAFFLYHDVMYMVKIWNETGETPTVQQLRKMADQLEKEIDYATFYGD